jgi:hypothetical protein
MARGRMSHDVTPTSKGRRERGEWRCGSCGAGAPTVATASFDSCQQEPMQLNRFDPNIRLKGDTVSLQKFNSATLLHFCMCNFVSRNKANRDLLA